MRLRSLALVPLALLAIATAGSARAPVPPVVLAAAVGKAISHVAVYEASVGGACGLPFAAPPGTSIARLSPDPRRLAYVTASGKEVRVVTLGGRIRTVLRRSAGHGELAWSPDGQTLAV